MNRFWSKVDKSGQCWEWTAAKNTYGYGVFRSGEKLKKAHRYSYEIANGSIPEGMFLDHTCHNRACVNPDHLRVVTSKQNMENLAGPHGHNTTSGVRGVYLLRNGKWQARTTHNKQIFTAGCHDTIEQAEAAVIALRNRLHTHNDVDRQQQAS